MLSKFVKAIEDGDGCGNMPIKLMSDIHLETPIFSKTYALYKLFYTCLAGFPKRDRYALGQRCEETLLKLMEGIIAATSQPQPKKLTILKRASGRLDMMKVWLRLAADLKLLDRKKYIELEEMVQEIGRMLGGWMRSVKV